MLSKMPIVVKSPPTIAHVLMRKARIGLRFCCVSVPSGEKSYLTVSGSPCTALFTAPLPNRHRHKRTKGSPIGKRASACSIYASRTEAGGRRGGSTGKRHAQRHTPVAHDRCRRPAVGRLSYGGPDRSAWALRMAVSKKRIGRLHEGMSVMHSWKWGEAE